MAGREKKPVHRAVMTEGKRTVAHRLPEEYDVKAAEDIQEALKDLPGSTLKEMMGAETDDHPGYGKPERPDPDDDRNGYRPGRISSSFGSMDVRAPQDRNSAFEPQAVKKRRKDVSEIDRTIISMYAKGMTTRRISDATEDVHGFEAPEGFMSDVTDRILPQIGDRQNRPRTMSTRSYTLTQSITQSATTA